jgi:hypothetical protein
MVVLLLRDRSAATRTTLGLPNRIGEVHDRGFSNDSARIELFRSPLLVSSHTDIVNKMAEFEGAWFDPDGKLAGHLKAILNDYESEREAYWSDDGATTRLREFIDAVATTMVESSGDLVLTWRNGFSHLDWATAKDLITILEASHEVRAKAELELAWRFTDESDQMAGRCVQLAGLLLKQRPSERVLRFVRRLGRCYIAGFFPESIMICRSILENAIDEELDRRRVFVDGNMKSKIKALYESGAISEHTRVRAATVWERGNTAIHKDPEAVGNAFETIRSVLQLLEEIQLPATPVDLD